MPVSRHHLRPVSIVHLGDLWLFYVTWAHVVGPRRRPYHGSNHILLTRIVAWPSTKAPIAGRKLSSPVVLLTPWHPCLEMQFRTVPQGEGGNEAFQGFCRRFTKSHYELLSVLRRSDSPVPLSLSRSNLSRPLLSVVN